MMRCSKTGISDKDWMTILDVINVYDPNDIAHVYPDMATPEFMQDVNSAFKAVLAHVTTNVQTKDKQQFVKKLTERHKTAPQPKAQPVDTMSLAYQQWIHDS